jgi:uncharacterized protein YndB with AHSA1/START domain/DNA-binding transcriptional ArsR family regulator
MEHVFRALADPNRRTLLDALHDRDGQALGELEAALPGMTRFGVMKHLRVLESAGLVTTRRDGRRKLHFLNPVPVQLIADRWISRYARPWTTGMADLKSILETPPHSNQRGSLPMSELKHVYEIYIRATPERIWQAITDPALVQHYYFNSVIESDFQPGSSIIYRQADTGRLDIEGEVVEADPPRKLVHTMAVRWDPEVNDEPTRVTWEITPMGEACLLSVTHDGFTSETETYHQTKGGWPMILSGLKTLVETGEPMKIEAPETAEVSA